MTGQLAEPFTLSAPARELMTFELDGAVATLRFNRPEVTGGVLGYVFRPRRPRVVGGSQYGYYRHGWRGVMDQDPDPDRDELSITVERDQGNAVLTLSGDVDVANGTQVRAELSEQLDDPSVQRVTADLRPVTFMSSTGIAVLVDAHWEAGQRGKALHVVVGDNHAVLHPLRMTGVDKVLHIDTRPESATNSTG